MKSPIVLSAVVLAGLSSAALADETASGIVTTVDRTSGVIVVQQAQSGTVGSTGNPREAFKVKSVPEDLHAGDKVTLSYTAANGTKTVTKLEQK